MLTKKIKNDDGTITKVRTRLNGTKTVEFPDGTLFEIVRSNEEKPEPKAPIKKEDVLVVTCIDRARDKNGKIMSYLLQDSQGIQKRFTPQILKQMMFNGVMDVNNLTLTSDGRLIEKTVAHKSLDTVGIESEKAAKWFAQSVSLALSDIEHNMSWSDEYEAYILRIALADNGYLTTCKYKGNLLVKYDEYNELLKGCSEIILVCKTTVMRSKENIKTMLLDFNIDTYLVENGQTVKNTRSQLLTEVLNYYLDVEELIRYAGELAISKNKPDINIEEEADKLMNNSKNEITAAATYLAKSILLACGYKSNYVETIIDSSRLAELKRSYFNSHRTAEIAIKIMQPFLNISKAMALTNDYVVLESKLPTELFESNKTILYEYADRFTKSLDEIKRLKEQLERETGAIAVGDMILNVKPDRKLFVSEYDKNEYEKTHKPTPQKTDERQGKQNIFNMFKH